MASPAQVQLPPVVDVPLSLFGGMHTGVAPADLPEGLSPDNQDMAYVPGEVFSRPCLSAVFTNSVGDVAMVYDKTYEMPDGTPLTLSMDALGRIYVENVATSPGVTSLLAAVTPNARAFSASAFGREYVALSNLLTGAWPPLQYDGEIVDRVTQDGPAIAPICANAAPPAAAIANAPAGATVNVSSATTTDPNAAGAYTTLTIVTAAPHGLATGGLAQLVGVKVGGYTYPAFTAVVTVIDATTFKIALFSAAYSTTATGTVTPVTPALVRQNNLVTGTTSAAHGFRQGWQVQVANVANNNIGGGIASISRDGNGVVTVETTNPHGIVEGSMVAIVGVTNPDTSFDTPSVTVASVPTPTTFTFQQGGTAETSSAGSGNVQDIWNVTAFIQSVPSPTTFTYENIGPNDQTAATGTATIIGQITPGLHNIVQMYLFRSGAISKPSPPTAFYANGGQQLAISNLALGNKSVVARIIGVTGAGGDFYFVLLETPKVGNQIVGTSTVIEDNTSTSAVIDFADTTILDGTAIDTTGNDLFDQRVLVAPIGFYSYDSRLACWGDFSTIQNLLNMTLGAGTDSQPTTAVPGSGTNDGSGGIAWTNPANIANPAASYADVSLTGGQTSQALLSELFGFAVGNLIRSISATFQYYYTGGSAVPGSVTQLSVQLLQAGVPIGAPQTLGLTVQPNQGSAATPLRATFQFPVGTLTPAEVNNAGFGFEITVTTAAAAVHLFANSATMTIGVSPLAPQGWETANTTSLTGAVVTSTLPGVYLQYQMTSGGGLFDCLIQQPAFQDAFGTAILLPLTDYTFRVLVNSAAQASGSLICDLFSPTQGQISQAIVDLTAGALATFVLVNFSAETPNTIPADTLLRIYLSNVPIGQVVTIAENSLIYTQNPTSREESFWSYVLNPEGIAQTTGNLGSANDPTEIRCFSLQRNVTLLKTAGGTHNFQSNDFEPDQWDINAVSRTVSACSIRAGDPGQFGTGDAAEDWDITANQNGLYLFAGGDFWKISQELDKGDPNGNVPTWLDINWAAEQTIVVKNDPKLHRIYVLAPINGATQPNICWMLDYKELDTSADLANAPALKLGFSGKMFSTDKTRKWSRWNISANCAEILIRPGNLKEMTLAGGVRDGAAFGNLYTFDPAKYTDDDYGQMFPYYDTYGFVNHEQEQVLQLGTGMKVVKKYCAFITGQGYVTITPFVNSLNNPLPETTPRVLDLDSDISNAENQDLEWTVGVRGQRFFQRVSVFPLPGETDVQVRLQKLIVSMTKDPVIYHRASAV
jgi:hypothetical protein